MYITTICLLYIWIVVNEVVVECLCNTGMKQQDVESMKSLLLYQLNMYNILSRCVGDTLTLSRKYDYT